MAASTADEVEALISRIGQEWARNWNARDLVKLLDSYAPDAVYMPPHHAAIHGSEAIREFLQGPLRHGPSNLKYEVTFIKHSGDLAYDVGRYSMTIGAGKQETGKYLTVWRRQADGGWKIAADAFSSDLPA